MYITKLHRLANNTLPVMFRVVKTVAISKQTKQDLMEPPRTFSIKKFTSQPKSTHYEENKAINFQMFLCVLNEKKGLTVQSIQKSIIWRPISIKYKFSCFETGERSLTDLTLQNVIFFISGLNSFTIFEILLFSFTLK